MKRLVTALIAVAIIWCALYPAQAASQPPNKQTQETAEQHGDKWPGRVVLWLAPDAITFFTVILAITSIAQGFFIWRQISLSRNEFNATHRPEIVIHSVRFDAPVSGTHNRGFTAWTGATVSYFNKGTTDATILEVRAGIRALRAPLGPDIEIPLIDKANNVLPSGGDAWINIVSDIPRIEAFNRTMGADGEVFCIGTIKYADRRGAVRTTGFCRRLAPDGAGERWVHVTEQGYGYEYAY